ncbi:MAG: 1-acyl-sn-glycerol-3-phosphate acyltransferase [Candidatus Hydromicrobium americanum]|nr:MAG: 1-acyl-sn-glycerol-3-phosphate acyltransferase [Candidatus Hydromicrobium americanum]
MLKTKHSKSYFILFKLMQFILRVIFNLLYRVEKIDLHKVPRNGKFIICSNHISYLDPVVIGAYIPRCVYFMAKKELYNNKFLSSLVTFLNAFPVERQAFNRKAFSISFEVLKDGNVLGLFPEGTRSTDGVLRGGKKGTGFIAAASNTPILPVAISGTNKIIQKPYRRIFFPRVKLIVGDIIDIKDILKEHSKKEAISIIVDRTMKEISKIYNKIK